MLSIIICLMPSSTRLTASLRLIISFSYEFNTSETHYLLNYKCLFVNSTEFTVKISFDEICLTQKSHHNLLILHGSTFYCSTIIFWKNYRWTQHNLDSRAAEYRLHALPQNSTIISTVYHTLLVGYRLHALPHKQHHYLDCPVLK